MKSPGLENYCLTKISSSHTWIHVHVFTHAVYRFYPTTLVVTLTNTTFTKQSWTFIKQSKFTQHSCIFVSYYQKNMNIIEMKYFTEMGLFRSKNWLHRSRNNYLVQGDLNAREVNQFGLNNKLHVLLPFAVLLFPH